MLLIKNRKITKFLFILISVLILGGCTFWKKDEAKNENEEITQKKKRFEPNVKKRLENERNSGVSIFGKKVEEKFANQNVMWKATLETLEFMPIDVASYSGGVISTGWYNPSGGDESLKITVKFKSDEIKSSSFDVVSFKKLCKSNGDCSTSKSADAFNNKIKEQIVSKIKDISIKKENKK